MVHALVEAGETVVVTTTSPPLFRVPAEGVPLFIGDAGDENLVEGVIANHGVEASSISQARWCAGFRCAIPGLYPQQHHDQRSLLNAR